MNYQYPINETWSKEEIIDVVNFFSLIEKAYEKSVLRTDLMSMYRRFKEIVPSKSEEKKLLLEFEQGSGYSSYHVIERAKESNDHTIKMKGGSTRP